MDVTKHYDYFKAPEITKPIHIIGLGAMGSTIAEMLARLGVQSLIHIWDFDYVTEHNLANQMFYKKDINKLKTEAVEENLKAINPEIKICRHTEYKGQSLSGYIFMCVDSMDVRKNIVESNRYYQAQIEAIFDFRMGLEEAQQIASNFKTTRDYEVLLKTMNFTTEDAENNVPKNSCGMELAIVTTIRTICALGVSNFINKAKGKELAKLIQINAFNFIVNVM